jgi:hypothetical protein
VSPALSPPLAPLRSRRPAAPDLSPVRFALPLRSSCYCDETRHQRNALSWTVLPVCCSCICLLCAWNAAVRVWASLVQDGDNSAESDGKRED